MLRVGTASNSAIPKLSAGMTDPMSKKAYNYSVFGEGLYYQLGASYENTVSLNTGVSGIETVYANTSNGISKLSGNYFFDPTLPSLFPIAGTINTASGGIFSQDSCFVMHGSTKNTFDATAGNCIKKKDFALKMNDAGLIGYWDMETLSGSLLKDLSGNGNEGIFS